MFVPISDACYLQVEITDAAGGLEEHFDHTARQLLLKSDWLQVEDTTMEPAGIFERNGLPLPGLITISSMIPRKEIPI